MSETWDACLEFGNYWQKEALEYMKRKKMIDNYRVMQGKFEEFDVITSKGNQITLREFKADKLAAVTGNLAIECLHKGKASGITSSTADYWNYVVVYADHADVYEFPSFVLKESIRQGEYSEIKSCNDGSVCYLFNKELFSRYIRFTIKP